MILGLFITIWMLDASSNLYIQYHSGLIFMSVVANEMTIYNIHMSGNFMRSSIFIYSQYIFQNCNSLIHTPSYMQLQAKTSSQIACLLLDAQYKGVCCITQLVASQLHASSLVVYTDFPTFHRTNSYLRYGTDNITLREMQWREQ